MTMIKDFQIYITTFSKKMNIKIIDNFLNNEDFEKISQIKLKEVGKKEVKVYHNSIVGNKIIQSECIEPSLLKDLNQKYHVKAINLLKELNKDKVDLYDYSEFHIIETGAECSFPIHDDTPNKLLSGVIYLNPEENSGTHFYNSKKGDNKKTIDWKKNRAVFFSRIEKETWHSYSGDGKNNRLVLVYNLMTNRIKKVFKIEKKFFLFGYFRYKINPILYRLFKITI